MDRQSFKITLALLYLYLIWGTPFLARRIALESFPPLMVPGLRFFLSGLIVFLLARCFGVREKMTVGQWKSAAIIGGLLLLGGNGAVAWSQQYVPSGIASLFIGMVPLWMVLIDWIWNRGMRPANIVFAAIGIGFTGIVLLIQPGSFSSLETGRPEAVAFLLLAAFFWALGSVYAQKASKPSSHLLAVGAQMTSGGLITLLASGFLGEMTGFDWTAISFRSGLAMLYLIFAASVIGYSIYIWLLDQTTPARVSTYAYVNPVIAVFLGWQFAGEAVTGRVFVAGALIIIAVAVLVSHSPRIKKQRDEPIDVP